MNQPKITLDFTRPDLGEQELAVMPANLAKRLLKLLKAKLEVTSVTKIMREHLDNLQNLQDKDQFDAFTQANLDFVIERQLIDNVSKENWDAYKVETEIQGPLGKH